MGKAYSHDDDQTNLAADEIYEVIHRLRSEGISRAKIILALSGELHGIASEASWAESLDN